MVGGRCCAGRSSLPASPRLSRPARGGRQGSPRRRLLPPPPQHPSTKCPPQIPAARGPRLRAGFAAWRAAPWAVRAHPLRAARGAAPARGSSSSRLLPFLPSGVLHRLGALRNRPWRDRQGGRPERSPTGAGFLTAPEEGSRYQSLQLQRQLALEAWEGLAAAVFASLPEEPAGGFTCPSSWLREEVQSRMESCFTAGGKAVN